MTDYDLLQRVDEWIGFHNNRLTRWSDFKDFIRQLEDEQRDDIRDELESDRHPSLY